MPSRGVVPSGRAQAMPLPGGGVGVWLGLLSHWWLSFYTGGGSTGRRSSLRPAKQLRCVCL